MWSQRISTKVIKVIKKTKVIEGIDYHEWDKSLKWNYAKGQYRCILEGFL